MAVTEAVAPAAGATDGHDDAAHAPVGGLAGLIGTVDHIVIGRLFVVVSLVFLVVSRAAGLLVNAERLDTSSISILDEYLAQVVSFHLLGDSLLFLLPAFLGLAIAIVPLQVGASTVAFPRAAAAAFWAWLLSGGVLIVGHALEGGGIFDADKTYRILLSVIGTGGVIGSLLVGVVCLLTTVLALRTAGMTVDRVPMFTWGMFVAGVLWLAMLPIALGVLVYTYLDVRYGAGIGASSRLRWIYGAPTIFAFAFPLVGVLLDIVPTMAKQRLRNRGILMGAVVVGGLLTFGADTLQGAVDGSIYEDFLYVVTAFALLLPLLAILGAVADTLRRGTLKVTAPLVLGIAAYLLLLAAVAANALRVISGLDLVGTSADSGVSELAVVAGILGVAAGLHFWPTKLVSAPLKDGAGILAALVLLLGGLAAGVPDIISGFQDQPFGVAALDHVKDGVEAMNGIALVGSIVVILGIALVLLNVAVGRNDDDDVPADPWDGQTLEWATASPPVPGGPGPLAPVTSAEPLLDNKEASAG
jgi:heme/copper-type cytochrome/quinol oxidase subunit 1